MKAPAITTQVGGQHYLGLQIRPTEFAMTNGMDPCAHSVLKYVSRHRAKGGRLDLEKAIHFIELREVLATAAHQVTDWPVTPEEYCRANRLPVLETAAVIGLCLWLQTGQQHYAAELEGVIGELVSMYPADLQEATTALVHPTPRIKQPIEDLTT